MTLLINDRIINNINYILGSFLINFGYFKKVCQLNMLILAKDCLPAKAARF